MFIEIWSEGYMVTGGGGRATLMWKGEADSFDDAVNKYNEESIKKYGKVSAVKGGLIDGDTMKPIDGWTIWGCKLFDNEQDARKSFG